MHRSTAIAFIAALALSRASLLLANPGDLDPSFGTGGRVTTDFGGNDQTFEMIVQPDGKIIAAGQGTGAAAFALARYNLDGSLDASFGSGGKVTTTGVAQIRGLKLQSDGKIVAVGTGFNATNDFGVARYNPNGTLDASFGTGGIVKTDFSGVHDNADDVVIQPDGKIVVAGTTHIFVPGLLDFALARYNSNGSLDASFGTGGKVVTDLTGDSDGVWSMLLQPDGKVVVSGQGDTDFAIVRYNANGTLDASFGSGGIVLTDFGSFDSADTILRQADGKLVAVGPGNGDFAVARYNSNGTLDPSFGIAGKVTTDFGGSENAYAAALQPDGKIVATGSVSGASIDLGIARYTSNGSLDPLFAIGGKMTLDFTGTTNYAEAVVVQADGKILTGGLVGTGPSPAFDWEIVRFFGELCGTAPALICRAPSLPQKALLLLKDDGDDTKDKLIWKWVKGEATPKSAYGNPAAGSTYYELCLYDNGGLVSSATVPSGGTCSGKDCWQEKTTSFKYKDKLGSAGGITNILLKEGLLNGKAKVLVKGKGANLDMPSLGALTTPVTAQLVNSDGECWGAQYSFPPILKNDGITFKDKAD